MKLERYVPPPGDPLRPYIDSIWSVQASGDYARETILPKGNVDILFNLSGPILFDLDGSGSTGMLAEAPYLVGLQTSPLTTRPQGDVLLTGISLRMESAALLVPLPLREVTDELIDGGDAFREIRELHARIQDAGDFQSRCALMRAWLVRMIRPEPRAELIRRACRHIGASPTDARFDRIASEAGISGRHLRRLFLDHVGVGPAHYLRLVRFTRALGLMPGPASLTEIAVEAHYFDQAHFCRDFKEISGMTPREYRDRAGRVPGHIFEEN